MCLFYKYSRGVNMVRLDNLSHCCHAEQSSVLSMNFIDQSLFASNWVLQWAVMENDDYKMCASEKRARWETKFAWPKSLCLNKIVTNKGILWQKEETWHELKRI